MGIVKLFVQKTCPKCPQAKQVGKTLESSGLQVREYDVETADGLAEASFYSVQATPTLILEDRSENMLADFRGQVPSAQQVIDLLQKG